MNLWKFIVSKCLTSSRWFWESKGNSIQVYVTGINKAFLKWCLLTLCECILLHRKCSEIPSLWLFRGSTDLYYDDFFFCPIVIHNLYIVPNIICVVLRSSQNAWQTTQFLQWTEVIQEKYYWEKASCCVSLPCVCHVKGVPSCSEQWFCVLCVATRFYFANNKL